MAPPLPFSYQSGDHPALHFGPPPMDESLSALMAAAGRGDAEASEALFTALYAELHRLARRQLARHGWGVSIGATSLLHEAYLDLSRREGPPFPDEQRFLGYAARVMRGLIIDYARHRQAQKRGGQFHLTSIGTDVAEQVAAAGDLMSWGRRWSSLALSILLADIVDLEFFCGFSHRDRGDEGRLGADGRARLGEKARIFPHGRSAPACWRRERDG